MIDELTNALENALMREMAFNQNHARGKAEAIVEYLINELDGKKITGKKELEKRNKAIREASGSEYDRAREFDVHVWTVLRVMANR